MYMERSLKMLDRLCGREALCNVVIVPTFAGDAIAEAAEAALFGQDCIQDLLRGGARYYRHYNTSQSAVAIIRNIVGNTPTTLQIQNELVGGRKEVSETEAGAMLTLGDGRKGYQLKFPDVGEKNTNDKDSQEGSSREARWKALNWREDKSEFNPRFTPITSETPSALDKMRNKLGSQRIPIACGRLADAGSKS